MNRAAGRALPWVVGLIGVILYHRYTIATLLDAVQADNKDSRFIAFLLEHWNAVAHGHARPGSPLIFYPVRGTLSYSDALIGMGAVHVVLRALGLGVYAAMNAQLILLSATSYAAAFLFLRRGLAIGRAGATVGAAFFAFGWARFAQLVHVQLQFTVTLPLLALLALECLRDGTILSRRAFAWRAVLFVALLGLTLLTTVYLAELGTLLLGLSVLPLLLHSAGCRHLAAIVRRQWPGLAAALLCALLVAVPVMRIYAPVAQASGGRDWSELVLLAPLDLVWMGRENFAWGWLFGHWPVLANAKWAEQRIGVGLVASLGWIASCVWAARALAGNPAPNQRAAALTILPGAALQLLALRIGGMSAWWLLYEFVPGMKGLRGITRIGLVVTLPMAVGFAVLVERGLQSGRRVALAAAIALAAFEQTGLVQHYSGSAAEAVSRTVADAIPRDCAAAYVVAAPGVLPPEPSITDPAQFDAAAYLAANADVAAHWPGSAWEHYQQFGRKEGRSLTPEAFRQRVPLLLFYDYTSRSPPPWPAFRSPTAGAAGTRRAGIWTMCSRPIRAPPWPPGSPASAFPPTACAWLRSRCLAPRCPIFRSGTNGDGEARSLNRSRGSSTISQTELRQ